MENEEDFKDMFVIHTPFIEKVPSKNDTNCLQYTNTNNNNNTSSSPIPCKLQNSTLSNLPLSSIRSPSHKKTLKQINTALIITDFDIQKNPTLSIEELNGELFNDKKVYINAGGLVNGGLRCKRDGVTYFGPIKEQNGIIINDLIINKPQNANENLITLFSINFSLIEKRYFLSPGFISNYGETTIFMKIESKLKIDKKLNLSLGEVHFSVEPLNDFSELEIEITYDINNVQKFVYDKNKKVITMGRGKKCDILLYNLSYSRIQSSFWFDEEENCWFIQDGKDEKKSTNGTWVFLNWNWKIEEDVQLRIGQNLLKISLCNN